MSIYSVLANRAERNLLRAKIKLTNALSITKEPTEYYFAYAGNLNLNRFSILGFKIQTIGNAILDGAKIGFTVPCEYKNMGFASFEQAEGSAVEGILYKCQCELLEYIDNLEWTRNNYYKRIKKSVRVNSSHQEAWIYQGVNVKRDLRPSPRYLNTIISSAEAYRFSDEYQTALKSIVPLASTTIDGSFNLSAPGNPRPKWPFAEYWLPIHDKTREILCQKLK